MEAWLGLAGEEEGRREDPGPEGSSDRVLAGFVPREGSERVRAWDLAAVCWRTWGWEGEGQALGTGD